MDDSEILKNRHEEWDSAYVTYQRDRTRKYLNWLDGFRREEVRREEISRKLRIFIVSRLYNELYGGIFMKGYIFRAVLYSSDDDTPIPFYFT